MSKLKRKWMRVIEAEETGQPLDENTRALVAETHPNLPILQNSAPPAQMMQAQPIQMPTPPVRSKNKQVQLPQQTAYHNHSHLPEQHDPQLDARLMQPQHMQTPHMDPKLHMQTPYYATPPYPMPQQMDNHLQHHIPGVMSAAEAPRM
jgi:hypothetical protein